MADTFALDVSKFVKKASAAPGLVIKKLAIDVLSKVVQRTPVGNPTLWASPPPKGYVGGRLRANWVASIGAPSFSTSTQIDKTGGPTTRRGRATIEASKGDADIYIMNSLPYVRTIEYDGRSSQAPAGMVRITVSEFQTLLKNAVRSLPK